MKKINKGKVVHFRDGAEWAHFNTSLVRSWCLPPEDPHLRGVVWVSVYFLPDSRWVMVQEWPSHPEDESSTDQLEGQLLEAGRAAEIFFRHNPSTVPVELLPLVKLRDCSAKGPPAGEDVPGDAPALLPIRPAVSQPDALRLIRAQEAACIAGVSEPTWHRMQSRGAAPLPHVRHSQRTVLYLEAEIRSWVAAGCPRREVWERMKPQALKVGK
jgi:predicted DNA-binding transcriptional regulator AlpA